MTSRILEYIKHVFKKNNNSWLYRNEIYKKIDNKNWMDMNWKNK